MKATILLVILLLVTYSVLNDAISHRFRKIKITQHIATSSTILLRWKRKIGDARLTKFKVAYVGRRNYHDRSNAIHEIVSRGQSMIVKSDRIILKDLTHCTNYSITIAGWNDLTTVTNKPMYIKTLPKEVKPIIPSITTQLKSDGNTHAVVTIYPTADNLGCKKYQLIVMLADNMTESLQWADSSLDEALTNQVNYIYIAAEFNDTKLLNAIELGDGKYYGNYLNKPLLPNMCYRVAMRIVFNKNSSLNPTYSELSPHPWCLKALVPATSDAVTGVNKSTATKAVGIAVGVMALLFVLVLIGWATFTLCKKKGLFYSDKIIKGPSLWDVVRRKKGPTILEQLISVDYHDQSTYEYLDEDIDLVSSGISVVRDVTRNPSEGSVTPIEHFNDDPITNQTSSERSETPIEHLYDDPATDSS